jgi:hypothetical protein
MAIECYYDTCPCHASHNCIDDEGEGPFCFEEECIINKYPSLVTAMKCAVVCGLYRVDEAVRNLERSFSMFLPYKDIPAEEKKLFDEYDAWEEAGLGDKIPKFIIDEENKKMDEFFVQLEERERYHQDKDCWVSDGEGFVNIHTGARMSEDEFFDYWNEEKSVDNLI